MRGRARKHTTCCWEGCKCVIVERVSATVERGSGVTYVVSDCLDNDPCACWQSRKKK